jgi:hypothetical protein
MMEPDHGFTGSDRIVGDNRPMFEMRGWRAAGQSCILFSFETDLTGRVKAGPQIEIWQGRSAAAFTPAVIIFIALPEPKDNIDPG